MASSRSAHHLSKLDDKGMPSEPIMALCAAHGHSVRAGLARVRKRLVAFVCARRAQPGNTVALIYIGGAGMCGWGRRGKVSGATCLAHAHACRRSQCHARARAKCHACAWHGTSAQIMTNTGRTWGYISSQVDAPTPASRTGRGVLTSCTNARGCSAQDRRAQKWQSQASTEIIQARSCN